MATKIYKGQAITLSTSEVAYELAGDVALPLTTVNILLVSGTLQVTAATASTAPILDATYATYSTAGDKIILDMAPQKSTLRMKCASAGIVNIFW